MKKSVLAMGMALLAGAAAMAAAPRHFVLATAGEVDAGVAESVRTYLRTHSGAEVLMGAPVPMEAGQTLERIGRAAATTLDSSEFAVLVLVGADPAQPQGVCLPHERFGSLNINRLGEGVSRDVQIRRAGQDGLRVMSMLLGMSACPFPLCVLVGYEKTEDLDQMSGNFCPPCHDRFQRLARAAGLVLVESAPPPEAEAPSADAILPAESAAAAE
jgi:hypothetical protein